jgi:hypothetical protein
VKFDFDGEDHSATTDADGVARWTRSLDESPGSYELHAAYPGQDSVYAASSSDGTFALDKENTRLSLNVKRAQRLLKVALADADSGAPIGDRKIVFLSGGSKMGTARTDPSGRASLRVPRRLSLDKSKVVFAGDDLYRKARATA